jgi:hypothetical protein
MESDGEPTIEPLKRVDGQLPHVDKLSPRFVVLLYCYLLLRRIFNALEV